MGLNFDLSRIKHRAGGPNGNNGCLNETLERSKMLLGQMKLKQADSQAELVISIDPKSPEPHLVKARILELSGDTFGAIGEYRKYVQYNRSDYEVRERLINLWKPWHKATKPDWYIENVDFLNNREELAIYDIGDFAYCGPDNELIYHYESDDGSTIRIGKFCSIAQKVDILLGEEHITDSVSTYPFSFALNEPYNGKYNRGKGDIIIGNDVWIGYGAIILSGVTIGDGAVIGARSVVTKDIPPYSIAVGNPALPIKKRFDDETIDELCRIKWWDWSYEKIKENVDILASKEKTREFIDTHRGLSTLPPSEYPQSNCKQREIL
jgi:acetyltransferase-like isoleucine patch superfamily enzyme